MPLKYFIHPETGEKLLVTDCLDKGLLSEYYPLSYLHACADNREWKGIPSTTQLINGLRMEYLKIFCDYAEDPSDQSYKIIGTRSHKKLERLTPACSFSELNIPEQDINMTADLLEEQPNGEWWMSDYKVSGAFKVAKALGLEKKQRPAFDENGKPVVYLKSGKWGKAGDQKMEDYYERNSDKIDMKEWILQLNRYRMIVEKYFNIIVSRLKIFILVRDGGTYTAKGYGIDKKTYYIDVPFLDNSEIESFYNPRREQFLKYVDDCTCNEPLSLTTETHMKNILDNCPDMCSEDECWNGRRCAEYCPVAEFCKMKDDNKYLKE